MAPERPSVPPQDVKEVVRSKRLNLSEISQADRLCDEQEFIDKYLNLSLQRVKPDKDSDIRGTFITGQFEGGHLILSKDSNRPLSRYSGYAASYDEVHRFTFDEEAKLFDYFFSALKKRDRLKKKLETQLKNSLPIAKVHRNRPK